MSFQKAPNIGIEIEFALNDIQIFLDKLKINNIEYYFMENPRANTTTTTTNIISRPRRINHTAFINTLVVKPERSLGLLEGWELNFPPKYSWENIRKVIKCLQECNPTFPDNAALHVHVDIYTLSQYNINQIHRFYYLNQSTIIQQAKQNDCYVDLNASVPEKLEEITSRKTNLNIQYSIRRHNTIEHRIYKSTMNIQKIKWCVEHTLNIIQSAITEMTEPFEPTYVHFMSWRDLAEIHVINSTSNNDLKK